MDFVEWHNSLGLDDDSISGTCYALIQKAWYDGREELKREIQDLIRPKSNKAAPPDPHPAGRDSGR